MKRFLSLQGIVISALLLPMLFLPMMHLHPASEHGHAEAHQAVVHADFFPNAVHEPENFEKGAGDIDVSIDASQHRLSEIDLLSPHIAQSFQFSSILKRKPATFVQVSFEHYTFPFFQRGAPTRSHAPPLQAPQISSPSLRAPPYFS